MKPVAEMNVSAGAARQPRQRRSRPSEARIAAALIATAGLVLLAAACSPSPASAGGSPNTSGSANSPAAGGPAGAGDSASSPSAVAYSQCMRSHGVPDYPDPSSDGQLPKGNGQRFGVSQSQYQAAQRACQHLLPTSGSFQQQAQQCLFAGDCPPALVQQMMTADRKFAQCMRSHGVPNWPDPAIGSGGFPVFSLGPVGITHSQTHNPPMKNTITECQRLEHATLTFGLREGP